MKEFIKDEKALFVLGGLHSPPYIKNRSFINENKIPLLLPWSAGGPITRYPNGDNWVFRLSIDDTKAGIRISEFALKNFSCKNGNPFRLNLTEKLLSSRSIYHYKINSFVFKSTFCVMENLKFHITASNELKLINLKNKMK